MENNFLIEFQLTLEFEDIELTSFTFESLIDTAQIQSSVFSTPLATNIIASLLLITPEEREGNPESIKEGLDNLFSGFQDILQGATSDDPEQMETARNRMQALRRYLENQGITISDEFDTLPDKLRDRCQTATSDPELKEKAQQFVEATEEVKQSFTNLMQTLKTGVEKFKQAIDEINEKAEAEQDAEDQDH
jgi:ElaB/YqjD/DUF883 family membrane-anchored ribosome-binding protein